MRFSRLNHVCLPLWSVSYHDSTGYAMWACRLPTRGCLCHSCRTCGQAETVALSQVVAHRTKNPKQQDIPRLPQVCAVSSGDSAHQKPEEA